jgi:hypothetical protein
MLKKPPPSCEPLSIFEKFGEFIIISSEDLVVVDNTGECMYKKRTTNEAQILSGIIKFFENFLKFERILTTKIIRFFVNTISKISIKEVKKAPYQLVNISTEKETMNPDIDTLGLFL